MKYFTIKTLKSGIFTLSLFVITSFMSGCTVHKATSFNNGNNQKWEDLFDGNEFNPVNENNRNLELKLKKAM